MGIEDNFSKPNKKWEKIVKEKEKVFPDKEGYFLVNKEAFVSEFEKLVKNKNNFILTIHKLLDFYLKYDKEKINHNNFFFDEYYDDSFISEESFDVNFKKILFIFVEENKVLKGLDIGQSFLHLS